MENAHCGDEGECGATKEDSNVLSPLSLSSSFGSPLSSSQDLRRMLKPPNKKKYEEEMEEITKKIRAKEAELKGVGAPQDTGVSDLRGIRAEREAAVAKRKKLDTDLKSLNQEITKKMGLLSRTESNLHYKNEAKIDDAIRNMEWQLKSQNFRLQEERRIVAEVDKLKRSKKVLAEYFLQKKEVDKIRESQRRMRGEKEYYYKTVTNLNKREEEIRKSSHQKKKCTEELKKELDGLYDQKRVLSAEYKQIETDHQKMVVEKRKQQRKESFKKREEDRKAKEQAWRKEMQEIEAQTEPFLDEKNLCNTLVIYLQQRYVTTEDSTLLSPRDEQPENTIGSAPGPADSLDDGMFVLLKKSEDAEADYSITNKRPNRRSRKGRKLSVTRPLAHTPQIIAQFSSLNLYAPSNMSEVTASIEQLQARKRFYDEKAGSTPRPLLANLSGSFSSSGSLSSLESPLRERSTTWGFVEVPPAIAENQTPSDAGTSAESGFHDMSRQVSKTESSESALDISPSDQALEELIQQSAEYESVHSRSSSDTITPDEHADDNNQSKSADQSCDQALSHDQSKSCDQTLSHDKLSQSCDYDQHETSQGKINSCKNHSIENQSRNNSGDSESSVFEDMGTKTTSATEDLVKGENCDNSISSDKVSSLLETTNLSRKISNYDIDFPPTLSTSNSSTELKNMQEWTDKVDNNDINIETTDQLNSNSHINKEAGLINCVKNVPMNKSGDGLSENISICAEDFNQKISELRIIDGNKSAENINSTKPPKCSNDEENNVVNIRKDSTESKMSIPHIEVTLDCSKSYNPTHSGPVNEENVTTHL